MEDLHQELHQDLQCGLGWFAAECEGTGLRMSTMSETMVLHWYQVSRPHRVDGEALPHVEEVQYLRVRMTSDPQNLSQEP